MRNRDEPGPLLMGTQGQHFAGMPVGSMRLRMQIVTVVEDDHPNQITHRGECRGARSDDDASLPS
jgi:hypothetical protein